jgi:aspartyl-tRNA(Asn)/glutamyl-tRNA(Gln) amidotransferase subunit B
VTRFDRKQYFYPDLPKGYQISQDKGPIVTGGSVTTSFFGDGKTIRLIRAHLEEDAGKGHHEEGGGSTLVDLNRCGIPLLEIVSAPDLRSAEDAWAYLNELRLTLRTLDISECDMEKGSLRCDVNVSIRPRGTVPFGDRVELKNLNSFRGVERAIRHEIERQAALLEAGGRIELETRLWDDEKGESRLMRKKESAPDYRYFPDPDLPPFAVGRASGGPRRRRSPGTPFEAARALHGVLRTLRIRRQGLDRRSVDLPLLRRNDRALQRSEERGELDHVGALRPHERRRVDRRREGANRRTSPSSSPS